MPPSRTCGRPALRAPGVPMLAAVTRPKRWFQALRLCLKLGWRSERGVFRHLAYLAEACLLEARLGHSIAEESLCR